MFKSKPPLLAVWCRVAALPLMRQAHNERMVDIMAKIKLQGISQRFDGVAAKDLKVGDVLIWNYGSKSEVVGIQPSKTGKSYAISCKSLQDGIVRERKTTAAREFAVERKEPTNPIDEAIKTRENTYRGIYRCWLRPRWVHDCGACRILYKAFRRWWFKIFFRTTNHSSRN